MSGPELSHEQRIEWLRLIRSERIGPRTFRALVNQYGGAGPALEALPEVARRSGRAALKITSRAEAEREFALASRIGARFVALGEPDYPKTLRATDTAPPLILVRGEVAALSRPCLAIVGSRNASAAGGAFAERLARELGEAGFVIVSGLARGIDSRAHRAALAGGTVAVLAGGHDRIYPSENRPLLEEILAEGGAIVSEMPMGWEPRGRDFPRRNRIVSGLSHGVIVVEAARRSGSLITARFALEQGREVFAVPGSPMDPRAEGANDLIRNGATLCASAEHVISAIAPLLGREPEEAPDLGEPGPDTYGEGRLWDELDLPGVTPAPLGEEIGDGLYEPSVPIAGSPQPSGPGPEGEREIVIGLMGAAPVPIDDLVRQSGLPVRSVQAVLLDLELAGRLERHGGNAVSLV